jgi:hypothetical protein
MMLKNSLSFLAASACVFAGASALLADEAGKPKAGTKPPDVPWCPADRDFDGFVTVEDLWPFLESWFGGDCGGDVNFDGQLTVQDLFDFFTMLAVGHCTTSQPTSDK